jgi:cell division protein FtsW (lipid II flippase)
MENSTPLRKIYQIGNFISFVAVVVVNSLANILPLNGKNTGELSDNIPNLFVPAGLTFSVWGVIYTLLAVFSIYQLRSVVREKSDVMDRIGPWFIVGSVANFAWIFFWHWQLIELSMVAMLVLLVSLLLVYVRLGIGVGGEKNRAERWAVHLTFSVYLGWITVATIANVTAVAVVNGWDGWGISESAWTVIVLIVAVVITLLMIFLRKDAAYTAVVIWAFLGIIIKRLDPVFTPQPAIVTTAGIGIGILVIALIVKMILLRKK